MNQSVAQSEDSWNMQVVGSRSKDDILNALKESNEFGPGQYLKQLRELSERSVTQVAAELGLTTQQVNAMEDNDYANLPAPIYVKSFLKRYCVLLDVPADGVINAFEKAATKEIPTLNRVSLQREINSRHVSLKWAGYSVAALILAFFIYWLSSIDFGGLWKSTLDKNASVENTSTELNLPVVAEETVPVVEEK